MSHYSIEITERQPSPVVDHEILDGAIRRVLLEERIDVATISLVLVSDSEIHRVNREFLGHDFPTDVISFRLNEPQEAIGTVVVNPDRIAAQESSESLLPRDSTESLLSIDGELIVSIDTAVREASTHGWSPRAELLLYVVHGLLHLCGYDDMTDETRPVMRSRERELLAFWGFCPTGLEP